MQASDDDVSRIFLQAASVFCMHRTYAWTGHKLQRGAVQTGDLPATDWHETAR